MPIYLFENIKTRQIHEVVFHMNDIKDYRGPDGKDDVKNWRRVWTKPQMAVDAVSIDPYSSADYVKATNKKGTLGDLYDRSSELAKQRADKEGGYDPIQEKFFENYSKRRKGRKHPDQVRREGVKKLKEKGITVEGLDGD